MSTSLLIAISTLMSLQVSVSETKMPVNGAKQKSVSTTPSPTTIVKHRGGWDGN